MYIYFIHQTFSVHLLVTNEMSYHINIMRCQSPCLKPLTVFVRNLYLAFKVFYQVKVKSFVRYSIWS